MKTSIRTPRRTLTGTLKTALIPALMTGLLVGCSPKFDWREFHATTAPYVVAFPAKPNTETRDTQLAGQTVKMSMSSVQVDGLTFAVASAALSNAASAKQAQAALQQTLLANIAATAHKDSTLPDGTLLLEARGSQGQGDKSRALQVQARLVAKDKYVYQVVLMGPPEKLGREQSDTFFTSFKTE